MKGRTWILGLAVLLLLWPQPAGAEKKIKEGTITLSFGPEPETMDPHTQSSAILVTVHRYVFDTLMHRPRGEKLPVPWAAKSYKTLDGGRTIEFHMREGVTFTNGEDVDAEAVQFSLMRTHDPKFKTVQRPTFRNIARVDVVSKWVARVHMNGPDGGFLNTLAAWGHLVPPKYYSKISQEDAAIKPIGSGPYKMVSWRKGVGMTLEANLNHWHPEYPKVKGVRIAPIPEMGTRVAALLKGEVDIIRDIPAQYVPQIRANPNVDVHIDRNVRIFQVGFDPMGGPTLDRRVRRAVCHAVDRKTIVKDVVQGMGEVFDQPTHQWTEGYDPNRKWPYEYDPQMSKKLLAEAGYPDGFSIGFISSVGRYPMDKEVAEAVAGMLGNVGIKVKHESLAWQTFVNRFQGQKKPGAKPYLYYYGYGNGNGDSNEALGAMATCEGKWSGYCNPAMDALFDVVIGVWDMGERERVFRLIVKAMAKDASQCIVWQANDVYGINKRVAYKIRNDDKIDIWEADLKTR